jgi:hypothetical protein
MTLIKCPSFIPIVCWIDSAIADPDGLFGLGKLTLPESPLGAFEKSAIFAIHAKKCIAAEKLHEFPCDPIRGESRDIGVDIATARVVPVRHERLCLLG